VCETITSMPRDRIVGGRWTQSHVSKGLRSTWVSNFKILGGEDKKTKMLNTRAPLFTTTDAGRRGEVPLR